MELLQLAMYIFFIVFVVAVSIKIFWLIFLLLCFRVWESILSYEFLSQTINFSSERDYYILIIIIAVVNYLLVVLVTLKLPIIRFALIFVMAIYCIKNYQISDILLLKDLFVKWGVWDINYWKGQFSQILSFSTEDFNQIIGKLWSGFLNSLNKMIGYIKKI